MLWGPVTYEMMEGHWPAVARGDVKAPPAMREWLVKLDTKPNRIVSSLRKDFPRTNSHHVAADLRTGADTHKEATPAGVLLANFRTLQALGIQVRQRGEEKLRLIERRDLMLLGGRKRRTG
jgi:hypothetical protein